MPPTEIRKLILLKMKLSICTDVLQTLQQPVLLDFFCAEQYLGVVPGVDFGHCQPFPQLLKLEVQLCSVLPVLQLSLPVCIFK